MHISSSVLVKSTYREVVSALRSLRSTIQPSKHCLNGSWRGIPAFQPRRSYNIFPHCVTRITVYVHDLSPVKSMQTVLCEVRGELVLSQPWLMPTISHNRRCLRKTLPKSEQFRELVRSLLLKGQQRVDSAAALQATGCSSQQIKQVPLQRSTRKT